MFELSNEQRKCFALPLVLDSWKKIEVKAGPYDDYITYAYLDGSRIVKVIQVSDKIGNEQYYEYGVDQTLSDDYEYILPKTSKGKIQKLTSPNLVKKTSIGMQFLFSNSHLHIVNNAAQCYYRMEYDSINLHNLSDLNNWVNEWCKSITANELTEIEEFSKREKNHQKYKEGDFFRFRINRKLYGYGRILVDYAKMEKDGRSYWKIFMGKPLCVSVYHIATEDKYVTPEQLLKLDSIPSAMVMDNIFFYGECEIIGNLPISNEESNYTIHYGQSCDARDPNRLYYMSGKKIVTFENEKELYSNFRNGSIGFGLNVELPILLECIRKKSNEPYWKNTVSHIMSYDLRNPKFSMELKKIQKQMGIK